MFKEGAPNKSRNQIPKSLGYASYIDKGATAENLDQTTPVGRVLSSNRQAELGHAARFGILAILQGQAAAVGLGDLPAEH